MTGFPGDGAEEGQAPSPAPYGVLGNSAVASGASRCSSGAARTPASETAYTNVSPAWSDARTLRRTQGRYHQVQSPLPFWMYTSLSESEPSGVMPAVASTENMRTSLTNPVHHAVPGAGWIQSLNGMARIPGFAGSGRYQLKAWWSHIASLQDQAVPTGSCAVRAGRAGSVTSKSDSWSERLLQSTRPAPSSGSST